MHRRVFTLAVAVVLSSSSALLLGVGSASAQPTVPGGPQIPDVSELTGPQAGQQALPGVPQAPGVPALPLELEQLLGLLDINSDVANPLQIAKDACESVVDLVDELAPPDLSQFKRLCGLLDLPLGDDGDDGNDGNDGNDGDDGGNDPVADAGSQVTLVPAGAVDTGDGSITDAGNASATGLLAGALALVGAGGTALALRRRTQQDG